MVQENSSSQDNWMVQSKKHIYRRTIWLPIRKSPPNKNPFIGEDLRLTVAAPNRPALVIFVDFLSAFDRMWFPALITHLQDLDMALPHIHSILSWLQNRSFSIHFGKDSSKNIKRFGL
ncbi:unnamed protein product [Rotaria socialis]|uniref:Reverse transcriptase domain-containing protein n=1 Tax=Rotaria socialis TaxID=392032 RepID=A0A821F417_9BILA|nr:unnamed protein product [Rotaria socialis]CAF4647020.1 unnamed protein product [Rotaria socialis]